MGIFSHGVGEWQNVYEAVPKKAGHNQPLKPLWGYENEADQIVVARLVGDYFRKPNYYKIDGKPVFSIYKIKTRVEGMGSVENVKKAFEYLDAATRKAGFKGVHLMLICPLQPYTFGKNNNIPSKKNASPAEVAEYPGFESFTTYNWICENYALLDKAGGEVVVVEKTPRQDAKSNND